MRSKPGFLATVAVGGLLLTLTPFHLVARAEQAPTGNAADGSRSDRSGTERNTDQAVAESSSREADGDRSGLSITTEEQRFIELTNRERARRGLGALQVDPVLVAIARQHSAEMRDKAYFNHQSPTSALRTPMDRYVRVAGKPSYACVGENLFYCSIVDVQRGHNALMASPTHRENILFPRFERMGVGIVKNEKGEFWVTEMFLTLRDPSLVASKKMSKR